LDTGDTAWVLTSTALVLFMTPGLAFFYGGMVRSKNVLGMLMQNFFAMGLMGVLWAAVVFSLAFGDAGNAGFIGNFDYLWLKDVGIGASSNEFLSTLTIPFVLFAAYQMTFAIITPALITGATADRLKFSAYAVFIGFWLVLAYGPMAHMVFGGGWLADMGALDFAGGAVVHMNAGAAALALVILLGVRKGYPDEPMPPHNLPFTILGTGILWFGWAGFNAGSALAANGVAAQAIMNTFLAASAAMLGWLLVEKIKDGHATTLGGASGAVAGLVAITPACGSLSPFWAIVLGLVAGAVCALAIDLKFKLGFDDSLDVVGIHLVGGLIGTLYLGFFASSTGLVFTGDPTQLLVQAIAALAVLVYSFVLAFVIGFIIEKTMGFRIKNEDEIAGIDTVVHGEEGYVLADTK
jgi:Amt family ammonium transporter